MPFAHLLLHFSTLPCASSPPIPTLSGTDLVLQAWPSSLMTWCSHAMRRRCSRCWTSPAGASEACCALPNLFLSFFPLSSFSSCRAPPPVQQPHSSFGSAHYRMVASIRVPSSLPTGWSASCWATCATTPTTASRTRTTSTWWVAGQCGGGSTVQYIGGYNECWDDSGEEAGSSRHALSRMRPKSTWPDHGLQLISHPVLRAYRRPVCMTSSRSRRTTTLCATTRASECF